MKKGLLVYHYGKVGKVKALVAGFGWKTFEGG